MGNSPRNTSNGLLSYCLSSADSLGALVAQGSSFCDLYGGVAFYMSPPARWGPFGLPPAWWGEKRRSPSGRPYSRVVCPIIRTARWGEWVNKMGGFQRYYLYALRGFGEFVPVLGIGSAGVELGDAHRRQSTYKDILRRRGVRAPRTNRISKALPWNSRAQNWAVGRLGIRLG